MRTKPWKPRINKAKAAFIAARTGEPVRDVEDWLTKQAVDRHNEALIRKIQKRQDRVTPTLPKIPKTKPVKGLPIGTVIPAPPRKPRRKFAKRPMRGAVALAKAIAKQWRPEWELTHEQRVGLFTLLALAKAGGAPTRGQVFLAAHKLGPFSNLPEWVQQTILEMGVCLPRKYGRIPLGDALTWEMPSSKAHLRESKAQVAKYCKQKRKRKSPYPLGMTFQKYITAEPAHKPVTFYGALTGYAVKQYGATRGLDYAQSTALWVMEYQARDLRRSEYTYGLGAVTDKRKAHRVRKATDKPNRWRKWTTRSLRDYWRWLTAILKTVAKYQGNLPENLIVLPYNDEIGPSE